MAPGGDPAPAPAARPACADIVHLCRERMERPQDAVTPELVAEAERRGQAIALWHEEDPARMAALRELPVFGICSDMPELVHSFRVPPAWPVRTVAHRGANTVAPQNTLPAGRCAFAAGFRAAGLPVMIRYMGGDPQVVDRVVAARPDIVNIDDIFLLRRRLNRLLKNTGLDAVLRT